MSLVSKTRLTNFWTQPDVKDLIVSDAPPRVILEKLQALYPVEAAGLTTGRISRVRYYRGKQGQSPTTAPARPRRTKPQASKFEQLKEALAEEAMADLIGRYRNEVSQLKEQVRIQESEIQRLHLQLQSAASEVSTMQEFSTRVLRKAGLVDAGAGAENSPDREPGAPGRILRP